MIGRGIFRREQDEKKMRRPAVERFEVRALDAAREDAREFSAADQFSVRNSDAFADSGAADLFARSV